MPQAILKGVAALLFLYLLLFFGLNDVGLLGPDEPRYASIGREMSFSGDWVTPVLWGDGWFEKEPAGLDPRLTDPDVPHVQAGGEVMTLEAWEASER